MKNKIVIFGSIIALIFVIGIMAGSYIATSNKEIKLRQGVETQQGVLKDFHTVVWKVLQEKAAITDNYTKAFDSVYANIMNERYEGKNGGSLFSFVTESNPNFDVTMYKDLAQTVEAKRTEFFYEQKKLRELNQQHKVYLQTFPGSLWVGGRDTVGIEVLSSTRTEETFKKGVDDETIF